MKFVCKQCYKRYPCGKSLGGHMRSHVVANSAEMVEGGGDHQQRFEHGGYSTYGLRENPKKTWRAVDSTSPLPQEKACKQCGKVFQSLKALCGHMACHSDKERIPTTTTRDRSQSTHHPKRYKKLVVKSYSLSLTNNNSIGSSSVSEIDEQEQEEVAKCLMMLSKDSGNWYGSVVEFSDNNSVVLETKSSSIDMKTSIRSNKGNGNGNGTVYKVCNNRDNETQNPPAKKMGDRWQNPRALILGIS
nr:zinc finger protein ZAT4-like [Ipomoea batatas]